MNKLNHDLIEKLAKDFIVNNKDLKNFNIPQYCLRVYIDNTHKEKPIVVKELQISTIESLDLSKIEEYFFTQCDYKNEYLVLVANDRDKSFLQPFIHYNFPDKSN